MSESSPHTVPALARYTALFVLVTVGGGLLVRLGLWVTEGTAPRMGGLATSGFSAYYAFLAWRGDPDGVSGLFWMFSLGAVIVTLVLAFASPHPDLLWVGALYVAVGLAVFGWAKFRPAARGYEPGGFKDWLTNRDYRDAVGSWFEARDAQFAADDENPPDCEELVASMLEGDDVDLVRARLSHQDERALPAICAALADRRYHEDEEVLDCLLDLLPSPPPAAAAPGLVACLAGLDGFKRASVMADLAAIGRREDETLLREALSNEETMNMTTFGLRRAVENGTVDPELMEALDADLRRVVARHEDEEDAARDAAMALVRHDPDFGAELERGLADALPSYVRVVVHVETQLEVIGPAAFRPLWIDAIERRDFLRIWPLTAVAGLDETELLKQIELASGALDDAPGVASYEEALEALTTLKSERAPEEIERAASLELDDLSDAAARQLYRLHGIEDRPSVDEESRDTEQARHLSALRWLESYTASGGLVQAIRCLDETDAASLPSALEEVAPQEIRDVTLRAVELLTGGDLPASPGVRDDLITDRYPAAEDELDELDTRFYAASGRLEWALAQYCVRHKSVLMTAFQG